MANELKNAVAQVRTVATVAGVRKAYVSEPSGPVVPCVYVHSINGPLAVQTLGNTSHADWHDVTVRLLISRAREDDGETSAFDFLDLLLAAFRAAPKLSNTVTDCEPTGYQLGYVDVGDVRYRAVDLTLRLRIDK